MTTATINYYILDEIVETDDEIKGYKNGKEVNLFQVEEETESELIEQGFAKCDAPNTQTYLIEETAWEYLNS